jgi:hypothetical protein
MNTARLDRRFLTQLQENPLDLRCMSAADAARALFDFIQRVYGPGDECSLWMPQQAEGLGYGKFWHVSWEAGPAEWGVLLSLGESMWRTEFGLRHDHRPEVMLQSGPGWYTEPFHRFDIGFIEDEKPAPRISRKTLWRQQTESIYLSKRIYRHWDSR